MSQGVRNNPEAPVFLCLSKLPTVPISSHQGSSNARNNPDHLEDIPALDEFGERSRWKFSAHWSLLIRGEYFEIVRTGLSMEFAPNRNVKHDVFYKKRIGTTRLSNEQIKDEGMFSGFLHPEIPSLMYEPVRMQAADTFPQVSTTSSRGTVKQRPRIWQTASFLKKTGFRISSGHWIASTL
jgi:hypothetical protein